MNEIENKEIFKTLSGVMQLQEEGKKEREI